MSKNDSSVDLRLLGDSGIYIPFLKYNTSGRLTMAMTQQTQIPVINNPEDAIVDTGFATQMVNFTYSVTVENDSIFLKVIKKYNNRTDMWSNDEWSSLILFVLDIEKNELVHYEIPRYRILGNKFGFEYNIDVDYLFSLNMKDLIPAGTRLAWSNANSDNTHKRGRNLNMFAGTLPESGEDCTLISRAVLKDYNIKLYDDYEVSYGKASLLADIHGKTNDTYKAFPDIGDTIGAGEVLFSKLNLDVRDLKNENYDIINNAMLFTNKGLKMRRPHFTDHTLLRYNGKVVDIDIHYNPKSGENIESDSIGMQTAKYLLMLKTYHSSIISVYEHFTKSYNTSEISPATNNLIVDSMTFLETPIKGRTPNITRSKKRSKLDMYTLKITVEHDISINNSYKFSDRYGGKGVVKILEPEDMPRDANGVVADIVVLSKGIVARTNMGKLYEQHFSKSSRQTKQRIKDILAVKTSREISSLLPSEINIAFNYLLDYLSYFNTTQYKLYSGKVEATKFIADNDLSVLPIGGLSMNQKIEILIEIFDKELYLIYNAQEDESAYDIVNRLEASIHKLEVVPIFIKDPISGGFKEMRCRAFIAPLYTVMLNKITDDFLGASTFFLNGYGLPTGKAKEDGRFPYKFKGVRGWGESEMRLVAAYGTPVLMQKLVDRSKSIVNHRQFIRNQLLTGVVTTNNLIPDRVEDSDVAINIVKAILEPAGITLETKQLVL